MQKNHSMMSRHFWAKCLVQDTLMTRNKCDNESSLWLELLDKHRFVRQKQDPAIQLGFFSADKMGRCDLRQMCAKEYLKYNFNEMYNRPKWKRSRTRIRQHNNQYTGCNSVLHLTLTHQCSNSLRPSVILKLRLYISAKRTHFNRGVTK